MTASNCREQQAEETLAGGTTAEVLAMVSSLRDQARLSAHNVVLLTEHIAGRRLAEARPARQRSPLERWFDAQGQIAARAVTGFGQLGSPLAAMALCAELSDSWLEANITLAEALIYPVPG